MSPSAFARKREASCNAILTATGQIIAEKGVDGFTISEIAQRAKINRALIYHYFRNRDNLVFEAINFVFSRYEPFEPEAGAEGLERSVRMHIEHPEVSRFFIQMLLKGSPLPALGERMTSAVEALERFKREDPSQAAIDPTFLVIVFVLAQISWAFARQEIARLLEISVDEADERFIAQLQRAAAWTHKP
jgi:AcrR family transcriptional regulator